VHRCCIFLGDLRDSGGPTLCRKTPIHQRTNVGAIAWGCTERKKPFVDFRSRKRKERRSSHFAAVDHYIMRVVLSLDLAPNLTSRAFVSQCSAGSNSKARDKDFKRMQPRNRDIKLEKIK
jgi:hypothetical protein